MGTRNLTAVVVDGQFKVAQYGQWDGYPDYAGKNVAVTMQRIIYEGALPSFADTVRACWFLSAEELAEHYEQVGIDSSEQWITLDDAAKFKEAYPQLDRDMGSDVIAFLYESGPCELSDETSFASDPLFCEWAYVVDLDGEAIEVYTGREDPSKTNRFSFLGGEVVGLLDRIGFDELMEHSADEIAERWNEMAHGTFDPDSWNR